MWRRLAIAVALAAYVGAGVRTELTLVRSKALPGTLLEDFAAYDRAVRDARAGVDPYVIRDIGAAFLYPPTALLFVEPLSAVAPFALKVAVVWAIDAMLIALVVGGVARRYGRTARSVWYWFPLCFGFAPFLELLHIGQINVVTMFGLFLLFVYEDTRPYRAAGGLCLAIATKASPVIFVGYLLVRRRYRAIAATVVGLAALAGVAGLRYGARPLQTYPGVFRDLLGTFPLGANSQSLVAKLSYGNGLFEYREHLAPSARTAVETVATFFGTHAAGVHQLLTAYVLVGLGIAGLATIGGRLGGEPLFIMTALAMTFTVNVMWYHHYVFVLLPVLVWMGWRRLEPRVVAWSGLGLFLVQIDRFAPPHGLTVHLWAHATFLGLLVWLLRTSRSATVTEVAADA